MAERAPWEVNDSLITPQLLDAVKYVESRGNVNAVSKAGARGPYQFMPATAKQYALADPHDEPSARAAAGRYLTDLANQFGGDVDKALLAYNWGPGNVRKGGTMPLEAQQYVGKVRMAEQKGKAAPETAPWEVDDTPPWEVDDTQSKKTSALPKAKSKYGLTEDPGMVEQFLGGAKHAWDKSAAALQAGAGKLGLPTGESLEPLVKQGKQFVEETGPASTVGNIGGEIALTAVPGAGAYRAVTMLPRAARMGRYGQALVGGGAAGAAGETMMGGNPLEGAAYGAAFGPAGTTVGDMAGGTVRGLRRLFSNADDTTSRYLRELSTNPAADAAALRALRGEVAGEMPTSGMAATVDPRMQYLAAIERQGAARGTGGAPLARDQANAAARMAPIENIAAPGRTTFPARQSPAELARSQGTTPMYARADEDRILLNPELEALVAGRQIQPAANRADIRFGQEQTNAFVGGRPVPAGAVARNEPNMQRDSLTNSFINGPPSSVVPNRSVRDLQTLKEQLNVSIDSAMRQGKMEDVRRLSQARNQLNERMRTQSPAYREATDAYRALSQPQNAAEIAQVYANALRDQGVRGLISARNNTARTLKRADQSSRFQHEGEVFTPQQMQDVNAVTRSAQRQADLNAIPDVTLPRQISAAEQLEENLPGMLSRPMMIARKTLSRLGAHTDEQVRAIIDEASLNPQRMADLLERVPVSERQNIIDAIRAMNPQGATTGAITGQIGQE